MTKSFAEIARNRRLVALAAIADRQSNGVAKVHKLPDLTQRHVNAMFRTRRTVPAGAFAPALAA